MFSRTLKFNSYKENNTVYYGVYSSLFYIYQKQTQMCASEESANRCVTYYTPERGKGNIKDGIHLKVKICHQYLTPVKEPNI